MISPAPASLSGSPFLHKNGFPHIFPLENDHTMILFHTIRVRTKNVTYYTLNVYNDQDIHGPRKEIYGHCPYF